MEERRRSFILFGYRLFFVFLFCAVCYLCLRDWLPFGEAVWLHLFILAVLSAAISALDTLKGRAYLYGALVLLSVCAVLMLLRRDSAEAGEAASVRVFFRETLYLLTLVLGIYLCHLLAEKFVWIRRASAILILFGLVALMVCKRQISHLGVAAAILYMVSVLTEYIESRWKKQKQGSETAYLLWLLPFLAGFFILTALMPYKDVPYDWAFFVNLFDRVQEKTIALKENWFRSGREDFGISTTGFSDETGFFGNLDRRDPVVMAIDNPNRYDGIVYLAGKCYNRFDGRQWVQNVQEGDRDCYFDTLDTLCAVYGYDGEYSRDYLRVRTIGVQYRYFHTGYLFAPLKTVEIKPADGKTEFGQQGGGFTFSKKQGYGTEYRLIYDQLNQDNPVFEKLISAGSGCLEQEAFERAVHELPPYGEKPQMEDLTAYRERIRKDYTEDIALSSEAALFLEEAYGETDTDYEKLLRLESALSALAYNAKPGRLPENVDTKEKFLEYFLVESKEGYCSYFASAFVLLARAEGLPARYVQGYAVPLAGRSSIEVTESMAHAWPEVWFEGIGWIPFEPTPGFYGRSRASWETHRIEDVKEETEQEENPQEKWENISGTAREESEEDLEAQLWEMERARRKELLKYLGCFLLMLVLLGILLLLADALWERKRAADRSPGESFRLEALRNLQILSALGIQRRSYETLSELNARLQSENLLPMEDFFSLCEEVLYGERVPDAEAVAQMRVAKQRLLELLREKKGKAYMLNRIGLYLMRVR